MIQLRNTQIKEKINTKRTGHNTYKERGQIKTRRWDKNILEAGCRSTTAGELFMMTDGELGHSDSPLSLSNNC
jgi:hypothetical protein